MGNSNEILAIQNIYCEPLGILKDYLVSDGFGITEILAGKEKIPENIEKFDAIFILGGPMSANDNIDCLIKQRQLVVNSLKLDIPILGICLGSQIIASSCGGNVFHGSKKEIGWDTVDITDEGKNTLFKNISSSSIPVFQWHADTFTLPSDVKVLSISDRYIQAFKFKNAVGIQFHLEVTKRMILSWIKEYVYEFDNEHENKFEITYDMENKIKDLHIYSRIVYDNFVSLIK